eukprot:1590693-Rhodomonas_salina.2
MDAGLPPSMLARVHFFALTEPASIRASTLLQCRALMRVLVLALVGTQYPDEDVNDLADRFPPRPDYVRAPV